MPDPKPLQLAQGFERVELVSMSLTHRLAFAQNTDLCVLEAGKATRVLAPLCVEGVYSNCPVAWLPQGHALLAGDGEGCLLKVDAETGQVEVLVDAERTPVEWSDGYVSPTASDIVWLLSCAPDKESVVFFRDSPSKEFPARVMRFDLESQALEELYVARQKEQFWPSFVSWPRNEVLGVLHRHPKPSMLVRLPFGSGQLEHVAVMSGTHPTSSPDGRWLVAGHSTSRKRGLELIELDGPSPEWKALTKTGTCPSWSPNGQQIAFMDGDGALRVTDLTGEVRVLLDSGSQVSAHRQGSYATAPAWSPNGRFLAFAITHTTRLDEPKNTECVTLQTEEAKKETSGEELERRIARTENRARWDFQHDHGVIDLHERTVGYDKGYWRHPIWSPG